MPKFEDWLPQEINQGPPLPEFLNIYWPWYTPPGAKFKVSGLVISPTEVNPGQVVTISCLVTNIGSEAGEYTVRLGGDFTAEQQVALNPGESRAVSFEVTPTVTKSYSVSVDGLTGSFKIIAAPAVASFYMPSVMDVKVTDGLIMGMYHRCEFSVTITNKGDAPGSFSASGVDNLGRTSGVSGYLEPGQSKKWSVWYHIDFSRMGPYSWELTGDWEGDNYSKGEARPEMAVISPAIQIGAITWDRSPPQFAPGTTHTAKVTMRNPTTRPWDYDVILYMGANQVAMATAAFHLNSGESKEVSFSVVMPTAEGEYPVYLDVSSGGQLIAHEAAGSVTLSYSWQFSGSLVGKCTRRFDDETCYYADIDYSITGTAPNFRWTLVYWDYHYTNTYSRAGNGAASGRVNCSGGAVLYAHPDPNARIGIEWTEGGMVVSGGFKLVASIGVGGL